MNFSKNSVNFRHHAYAEMKCAAPPGGTFAILLPGPALSTAWQKPILPHKAVHEGPISKEKLLVGDFREAQMLAP